MKILVVTHPLLTFFRVTHELPVGGEHVTLIKTMSSLSIFILFPQCSLRCLNLLEAKELTLPNTPLTFSCRPIKNHFSSPYTEMYHLKGIALWYLREEYKGLAHRMKHMLCTLEAWIQSPAPQAHRTPSGPSPSTFESSPWAQLRVVQKQKQKTGI